MPWCPVCKLEYVEGSTECPDCKVKLVDSLEEAEDIHEEIEEMEDAIEENFQPLMEEAPDEETTGSGMNQTFPVLTLLKSVGKYDTSKVQNCRAGEDS